jgi:hypothetical protein
MRSGIAFLKPFLYSFFLPVPPGSSRNSPVPRSVPIPCQVDPCRSTRGFSSPLPMARGWPAPAHRKTTSTRSASLALTSKATEPAPLRYRSPKRVPLGSCSSSAASSQLSGNCGATRSDPRPVSGDAIPNVPWSSASRILFGEVGRHLLAPSGAFQDQHVIRCHRPEMFIPCSIKIVGRGAGIYPLDFKMLNLKDFPELECEWMSAFDH